MWTGSSCFATIASLRFQPTKRPQVAAQKAKARAIASKFALPPASKSAVPPPPDAASEIPLPNQPSVPLQGPTKTTIKDWTTSAADDGNVDEFYAGEKRARGGRKKRKKNRAAEEVLQNWDDIYDPSRPNNYDEYKNSEEKIREVREWKDRLYAHRVRKRSPSPYTSNESQDERPVMNSVVNIGNAQEKRLTVCFRTICSPSCDVFCSSSKSQQRTVAAPRASNQRAR